ncbi:MAG: peptidylprolyl isomerase [Candidatus Omnitrophota bacterium]|nr:peptidylprolyl isomerase [Candidatus Omnitrophota bacterium]
MINARLIAGMVGFGVALTLGGAVPAEESQAPAAETAMEAAPPVEAAPLAEEATAVPAAPTVQDNLDIGLEYTLTVEGSVVDTTDGRGPFHYIHGQGQMIPGLERELIGLHVGDTKEVAVSPEDGYGAVDPAAFVEVPKDQLPSDVPPTVGMVLRGVNPDGKSFRAKINEVKDTIVVLDLNHPLAGKTLTFQVKVTDISPPAAPGQ